MTPTTAKGCMSLRLMRQLVRRQLFSHSSKTNRDAQWHLVQFFRKTLPQEQSQGFPACSFSTWCGKPALTPLTLTLSLTLSLTLTNQEARALARCRDMGVKCPALYAVDKGNGTLYMEYFADAITTKEYINQDVDNKGKLPLGQLPKAPT